MIIRWSYHRKATVPAGRFPYAQGGGKCPVEHRPTLHRGKPNAPQGKGRCSTGHFGHPSEGAENAPCQHQGLSSVSLEQHLLSANDIDTLDILRPLALHLAYALAGKIEDNVGLVRHVGHVGQACGIVAQVECLDA